jgi:DNA helicase HerA-like ATPase
MGLVEDRIVLIVGFCGSGKSTAAAKILKQKNGVLVFDPHGDPAYAWIPNTARTIEELEDSARWVREAKPPRVWLRDVPDGRLDPYDALNDFCARKKKTPAGRNPLSNQRSSPTPRNISRLD